MIPAQTYRTAPSAQLLPSAGSALALARGEPGALWAVIAHTAARALVMAPAGIAAGAALKVRPAAAVAIVLAAAVGIEVGIIALALRQAKASKAGAAAAEGQSAQAGPAEQAQTLPPVDVSGVDDSLAVVYES